MSDDTEDDVFTDAEQTAYQKGWNDALKWAYVEVTP